MLRVAAPVYGVAAGRVGVVEGGRYQRNNAGGSRSRSNGEQFSNATHPGGLNGCHTGV
jgi:hypothetical protein